MKIPMISNWNHKETTNYVCHLIFQFPSFLTTTIEDQCKGCQCVGNIPVCQNTKPSIKEQQTSGDRQHSFILKKSYIIWGWQWYSTALCVCEFSERAAIIWLLSFCQGANKAHTVRWGMQFCVIPSMELPVLGESTPTSKASGAPQTGNKISVSRWRLLH